MKKIVILGAGAAGTIMANRLAGALSRDERHITIVDRDESHPCQPGFLFAPFGMYTPGEIVKPRRDCLPRGIEVLIAGMDLVEPERNEVRLQNGARADVRFSHHCDGRASGSVADRGTAW